MLIVKSIVIGDINDRSFGINNRYSWGISGMFNTVDVFTTTPIVRFETETGFIGEGEIPANGSLIQLESFRGTSSQIIFDRVNMDRLGFLVSSTDYQEADIDTILSNATFPTITTTNLGGIPETNAVQFPFNRTGSEILYLIWDYIGVREILRCDSNTTVNAKTGYFETLVNIGRGTGTVSLNWDMDNLPNRMDIVYDGAVVADTLYQGAVLVGQMTNLLAQDGRVVPQFDYTLTDGVASFPDSGLEHTFVINSGVIGIGGDIETGTTTFEKTSQFPETMLVRTYAPLGTIGGGGAGWSFTLDCP